MLELTHLIKERLVEAGNVSEKCIGPGHRGVACGLSNQQSLEALTDAQLTFNYVVCIQTSDNGWLRRIRPGLGRFPANTEQIRHQIAVE